MGAKLVTALREAGCRLRLREAGFRAKDGAVEFPALRFIASIVYGNSFGFLRQPSQVQFWCLHVGQCPWWIGWGWRVIKVPDQLSVPEIETVPCPLAALFEVSVPYASSKWGCAALSMSCDRAQSPLICRESYGRV